ncbi:hypothetical protein D9M69_699830 [compost metagenome]
MPQRAMTYVTALLGKDTGRPKKQELSNTRCTSMKCLKGSSTLLKIIPRLSKPRKNMTLSPTYMIIRVMRGKPRFQIRKWKMRKNCRS